MIDELLSGSIVQTSLLFALIFPAAMIAAGAVISGVQHFLTKIITAILGSGFTFILVNYLMFPGVMLHEISHATMAYLTGAKVTEVALFEPSGGTLGYVNYRTRGPVFLQSIQRVMASSAPVYLGAAFVYLFYFLITTVVSGVFWKVILGYIAMSMIFHMTMSAQDFKTFFKGLPAFIVSIFCVSMVVLYFTQYGN